MQRGDDYLLSHLFFLLPPLSRHMERQCIWWRARCGRVYEAHTGHFVPESMCAQWGCFRGTSAVMLRCHPSLFFCFLSRRVRLDGLSHSCPPPVSEIFFSINFIIEPCSLCSVSSFFFLFFFFFFLLTSSLLSTHFGKVCLTGFHLKHISFFFRCCEILLFFLPFGLSFTTHLCSFSLHLTVVFMVCQTDVLIQRNRGVSLCQTAGSSPSI